MRGEIIRRIRALEQQSATREAERLPSLPLWYRQALEAHLGVPVDEYGRLDSAGVRRKRELKGLTDDSPSADVAGRDDTPKRAFFHVPPIRLSSAGRPCRRVCRIEALFLAPLLPHVAPVDADKQARFRSTRPRALETARASQSRREG
jgi:hypothetical protein